MGLFPTIRHPYFIYAPAYTHTSSGVRALHLLCHALNLQGEKAYIWPFEGGGWSSPLLNTPYVDANILRFYREHGVRAIVVYPEIARGDPLGVGKAVRYLLASSDEVYSYDDFVVSYTTPIAKGHTGGQVMTIPTIDKSVFYTQKGPRKGECFYAHKYDRIHGYELSSVTEGMTRLEGSPHRVAEILRNSEMCYTYEMSETILCAQLCGCPVQVVKTPYFSGIPLDWDFPWQGVGPFHELWYDDFLAVYERMERQFPGRLMRFIRETQEWIKL